MMPFGGAALVSDDELITAMVRPPGHPCGGDRHIVSDKMRHSASVREAIALGWIVVTMDAADSSDFVAQVELNSLAALVSGLSGFSGFSGAPGLRTIHLDFHGAADTANIDIVDDVPFLLFKPNKNERSIWTVTVPDDYQAGTDMFVEVFWSPTNTDTGNVRWLLEHKVIASGSTVGGATSTSSLVQAAAGTAQTLQTTGSSLSIPAASVTAGALASVAVNRLGKDAADTHTGTARAHLARVRYTGLIFS